MYAFVFLSLLATVPDLVRRPNARSCPPSTRATPRRVALLEKAVNINSGTHNFAGVRAVGDLFRKEFDALGFQDDVGGRRTVQARRAIWSRSIPGKGPRMLLIGHLDTVFERDSPFQTFQRIDDKTAKGPGIIDMKGGDVIIIAALKALKAAGAPRRHEHRRRHDRRRGGLGRSAGGRARRARRGGERRASTRSASRTVRRIRSSPSRRAAAPRPGSWRSRRRPATRRRSSAATSATARTTSWRGSSTASGASSPARRT